MTPNHAPMNFHDIDWGEVAQFFADHDIGDLECCPWCDIVANAGGGPIDEERAVIMRANRNALTSAPFWPAVSAWLEAQP